VCLTGGEDGRLRLSGRASNAAAATHRESPRYRAQPFRTGSGFSHGVCTKAVRSSPLAEQSAILLGLSALTPRPIRKYPAEGADLQGFGALWLREPDCGVVWGEDAWEEVWVEAPPGPSAGEARGRRRRCRVCSMRRPVMPGEKWDLGHLDGDPSQYQGPEHVRCNRRSSSHRAQRRRYSFDWDRTGDPFAPKRQSRFVGRELHTRHRPSRRPARRVRLDPGLRALHRPQPTR